MHTWYGFCFYQVSQKEPSEAEYLVPVLVFIPAGKVYQVLRPPEVLSFAGSDCQQQLHDHTQASVINHRITCIFTPAPPLSSSSLILPSHPPSLSGRWFYEATSLESPAVAFSSSRKRIDRELWQRQTSRGPVRRRGGSFGWACRSTPAHPSGIAELYFSPISCSDLLFLVPFLRK